MRWWYAAEQNAEYWWDGLVAEVRDKAAEAGAVLRSETPVFGWMAENRRDRRLYPCSDSARGARPAWIWYGDIER